MAGRVCHFARRWESFIDRIGEAGGPYGRCRCAGRWKEHRRRWNCCRCKPGCLWRLASISATLSTPQSQARASARRLLASKQAKARQAKARQANASQQSPTAECLLPLAVSPSNSAAWERLFDRQRRSFLTTDCFQTAQSLFPIPFFSSDPTKRPHARSRLPVGCAFGA